LVAAACLAFTAVPVNAQAAEWAPGRLVVQAKAGLSAANVGKLVAVHGGKARRMGASNLFVVELPANASETAVLALLKHNPHFKFAELDHRIEPLLAVNDPYSGSAWHLNKIGAPAAWDTSLGAGVTIAVLDSGVDGSHPDLASRLVPGWNFYDNNNNTSDVYGHGTQVAGAAAATLNNALGVPSVAGQAFLMPIRVSDTAGYGYTSMIANGLVYAADRGVKVANISFANMPSRSAVVSAAQYMKDKGGLVVAAAGNTGTDLGFTPTTSMVVVSGTTSTDQKASWSSHGNYVSLAAPGAGIYTTTRGGGYSAASGTSVASPVAAGVAALAFAANPALKGADVERILFSTAVDLGTAGRDSLYGHGRVNAAAAVASARSFVSTADTQAPSVAINSLASGTTVSGLVAIDVTSSDNVGVTRVDLLVNGSKIASDTAAPYAFSWDSNAAPNGSANLSAVAYDAAGNSRSTDALALHVANAADLSAPTVAIGNPRNGSRVSGNVSISVSAADDRGTSGLSLRLLVNGRQVATSSCGTLSYSWNTRKLAVGTYSLTATATDKAGNTGSSTVTVSR
jgi:subtilisin family serine protease